MVHTEVPQGWSPLSTSKSTSSISLIPFVGNPHHSKLVDRVRYLKIYLCLEDNRSSFSQMSLKSENMDACPQTVVLFCLQNICIWEKKIDVKQLKMNNFTFDARYLKMNKFIKYFLQFIISTSSATFEVPLYNLKQIKFDLISMKWTSRDWSAIFLATSFNWKILRSSMNLSIFILENMQYYKFYGSRSYLRVTMNLKQNLFWSLGSQILQ